MTQRQSNNHWSGSIAAHPAPKNSAGKVFALIFWDQDSILLIDYLPKGQYQRGVLLISAGAIERHFEGKTLQEGHQGGLVLARQCPGSPGTCIPKKLANLGF